MSSVSNYLRNLYLCIQWPHTRYLLFCSLGFVFFFPVCLFSWVFFVCGVCSEAFCLHWNEIRNVCVTRSNVYLKLFFSIALTFKHSQREDRIIPEYQNLASPQPSKRCVWTQLSSCLPAPNLALEVFHVLPMLCRPPLKWLKFGS